MSVLPSLLFGISASLDALLVGCALGLQVLFFAHADFPDCSLSYGETRIYIPKWTIRICP